MRIGVGDICNDAEENKQLHPSLLVWAGDRFALMKDIVFLLLLFGRNWFSIQISFKYVKAREGSNLVLA